MRISTAEIKLLLLECAEDGKVHAVSDFKQYMSQRTDKEYSSGQVSGALYQLTEMGVLVNLSRGLYQKGSKSVQQTEMVATNTIAQTNSEFRKQIKHCLQNTEQELERIVNQINVWELTTADFEFLGEIKRFNEQMNKLSERCAR